MARAFAKPPAQPYSSETIPMVKSFAPDCVSNGKAKSALRWAAWVYPVRKSHQIASRFPQPPLQILTASQPYENQIHGVPRSVLNFYVIEKNEINSLKFDSNLPLLFMDFVANQPW